MNREFSIKAQNENNDKLCHWDTAVRILVQEDCTLQNTSVTRMLTCSLGANIVLIWQVARYVH